MGRKFNTPIEINLTSVVVFYSLLEVCSHKFGRARMWHAAYSTKSTQNQQSRLSCKCSIERAITQINKILTSTPILHTHLLKTNGRCELLKKKTAAHGEFLSSNDNNNREFISIAGEKDAIALSPWRANLRISRSARRVKDHRTVQTHGTYIHVYTHSHRQTGPSGGRPPQLHSGTLITSVCPRAHCFYSA